LRYALLQRPSQLALFALFYVSIQSVQQEHPHTIFLPGRELIGIAPRDRFRAMTHASQAARAEKSWHSLWLLVISIHANVI
jgi:hypothetical protein